MATRSITPVAESSTAFASSHGLTPASPEATVTTATTREPASYTESPSGRAAIIALVGRAATTPARPRRLSPTAKQTTKLTAVAPATSPTNGKAAVRDSCGHSGRPSTTTTAAAAATQRVLLARPTP